MRWFTWPWGFGGGCEKLRWLLGVPLVVVMYQGGCEYFVVVVSFFYFLFLRGGVVVS